MQNFSASPREMIASLYRNRNLIRALVKREVVGRYRGSFMGLFWSFLNPLFMLAVYTFVFSFVFKARWSVGSDSKAEFALVLFSGLMVFNIFADCINKSPSLIVANVNYVKKVVFPLEVLPWVMIGASLFHAAVSLLVWVVAYCIFFGYPSISIVFLPLVILPLILFIVGLSWGVSSLGVYLRDVAQFIGIVVTTMMFVSPIFYPATALPEQYRQYLYMNPLTPVIEQVRDVLFWGRVPDFKLLAIYTIISMLVAFGGFAWFQKTRKGFADVL